MDSIHTYPDLIMYLLWSVASFPLMLTPLPSVEVSPGSLSTVALWLLHGTCRPLERHIRILDKAMITLEH